MDKINQLEYILDGWHDLEIIEGNKTGDEFLKIEDHYKRDETLYINFWELIHLLKHYTGVDRVIKTESELKKEEEL